MHTFLFRIFLLFLITPLLFGEVNAQRWERAYGYTESYANLGYCVQQTTDGGYVLTARYYDSPSLSEQMCLIKTDANGALQFFKTFGGAVIERGHSLKQTADGGYIVAGYVAGGFGPDYLKGNVYVVKTDAYGNVEWEKTYGDSTGNQPYAIEKVDSSGYVIVGMTSFGGIANDIYVVRINISGDTLWTKSIDLLYSSDGGFDIKPTTDKGFIIVGYMLDPDTSNFNKNIYILKLDSVGDTLWSNIFWDTLGNDEAHSVQQTSDGGYILTGKGVDSNGTGGIIVIKTDMNGNEEWTEVYSDNQQRTGYCIQITSDNGYIILGRNVGVNGLQVYYFKTDEYGNVQWQNSISNAKSGFSSGFIQQTSDGGYIITAGNYFGKILLAKTDSLGNTFTNFITGSIYNDLNSNCVEDLGEIISANQMVKLEPGPFYETTDSNGSYSFRVDTGTYTVTEIPLNYLWGLTCPSSPDYYTVNFTAFYDTSDNNNFGNEITTYCPILQVDISTWALRPCMNAVYTVTYDNEGTIDANGVYIDVEFDNFVTPVSSSIPWSSQNGNTYTFNIGTIAPFENGLFQIITLVSCSSVIGSTHCIEARILPEVNCFPPPIVWDQSSVEVEGYCSGDSLACFMIYNTGDSGNGNMDDTSEYRIYENNVLVSTGTFQLAGGDSTEICWPANGNTIRLESDQRPGHPGNSHPQGNVELCGGPPNTLGQITLVPQDDLDDNVEIVCTEVTVAVDPNDKSVKPVGLTSNHYIDSSDVLEYQINFQNTGTDTAFKVVIRDTLSQYLNIITTVSGASSHPYSFRIYGQGILEWTFDNILLPDSGINEVESHGFVKFKVNQVNNNPMGTLIENNAGIIFDFNAPIITNTTSNIVWDWDSVALTVPLVYVKGVEIMVYPNPFTTSTTFILNGLETEKVITFELYDLIGNRVRIKEIISRSTFDVVKGELSRGLYLYKLSSEKQVIGVGKLLVQ